MEQGARAEQGAFHSSDRKRIIAILRAAHKQPNHSMSVGLDAALATLREKNHPGTMQTSAEVLLTILGNVRELVTHTTPCHTPLRWTPRGEAKRLVFAQIIGVVRGALRPAVCWLCTTRVGCAQPRARAPRARELAKMNPDG